MVHSGVSVDDFADTANARVSFDNPDRLTGGLGAAMETAYAWGDRQLSLQGSLDIERIASGASTSAHVSGVTLQTVSERNAVHGALSGLYREAGFSLGAALSMRRALGSHDRDVTGLVTVGLTL